MEQSFLSTFAYAKINLALAIQGIREDGYHELQSVMQSIALHDIVRVRRRGEKVVCRCGALSGPGNIAHKAAVMFLEQLGQFEGIEIEIEKHIPVQAGLAGGSTDAAATLRLLNQLYGEPLSREALLILARKCGADVAFCLRGGTMWATGRGERLEVLPTAPTMDFVLTKPFAGVNTREAYLRFDTVGQGGRLRQTDWKKALAQNSTQQIADLLYNDLELVSSQMVPEILVLKQHLLEAECYGALMSGSGSCVFGIAQGKQHA
ncbi:MAG TPA: 4-(cytidine 5'-diphospho)-2-C-methyl-D-erythritol kinase, partial [Desulfosporosinus sp.]|nr:4-(cytidine 5'-diphospho)-2-C-methyl-D-erythritol kinase [Desulfosporosinus sp.]